MNPSYIRHGGVARDLSEEFLARCQTFIDKMPAKIDEYESLLTKNEIFLARTKGIGMLPPELCKEYSVTVADRQGQRHRLRHPPGRAVRHLRPLRLRGPVRFGGDAYDRYLVRVQEMRESVKIVRQALRHPPGRHPGRCRRSSARRRARRTPASRGRRARSGST